MSDNVAGPAIPLAFVSAKQTANKNTGGTNGTFTILSFTDDTIVANGIVARPTASRFQALIAGYYRFTYEVVMTFTSNNTGAEATVFKNTSTRLPVFNGRGRIIGQGLTSANGTVTVSKSKIILLAANDYVELSAAPLDGSAVQITADSSAMLELVRPV